MFKKKSMFKCSNWKNELQYRAQKLKTELNSNLRDSANTMILNAVLVIFRSEFGEFDCLIKKQSMLGMKGGTV